MGRLNTKKALKKMEADGMTTLESKVNRFLFTFRRTLHTVTGVAPAKLIFKQRLRTTFHLIYRLQNQNGTEY